MAKFLKKDHDGKSECFEPNAYLYCVSVDANIPGKMLTLDFSVDNGKMAVVLSTDEVLRLLSCLKAHEISEKTIKALLR